MVGLRSVSLVVRRLRVRPMFAVFAIFNRPVELAPPDVAMRRARAMYPCAFVVLPAGCVHQHFLGLHLGYFHHRLALRAEESNVVGVIYA